MRRLLAAAVTAVSVAGMTAGGSEAAAPRIVIFSGKPLARHVVVSDWQRISMLVQELANRGRVVAQAQMAHRPRLKVSMFWGRDGTTT
jgi:hypothetical protein